MKTIVTHSSPDEDALASVWLIHKFYEGWDDARVDFVPAGKTLHDNPPDSDPNIMHVDTGLGKFDHHQTSDDTCAARLVFEFLKENNYINKYHITALDRLVGVINDYDHFQEVFQENADSDMNDTLLVGIVNGLRTTLKNDQKLVEVAELLFDGLLKIFENKINAEEAVKLGFEFESYWGKTLSMETESREATALAQKKGVMLVISKSRNTGQVRIKLRPDSKKNLEKIHEILVEKDPGATWFYHASGHMLLNGSTKNPDMVPTKLSLKQVVEYVKLCH